MSTKAGNTKHKPTSRGMRKHVRRMKQEARKGNIPDNQRKKGLSVTVAPKE